MAQDPFLIDQIQIEPAEAGTRLIRRAADGSLQFLDAIITGGITLQQLAGLGSIGNVLVVGKSGAGAKYTTIQSALDTVPSSASAANPYVILVLPGVYTETVNIVRDGVRLVGVGKPTIESALEATPDAVGADHTVIVSAQLGTVPLSVLIQGFKITNAHTNKACLRVVGSAGSTLLKTGGLDLFDLEMSADAVGGNYTVWASTAGLITANGCILSTSSALSLLLLQEMSRTIWRDCAIFTGIQCRYDTSMDEPDGGGGNYFFQNCPDLAVYSSLTPAIAVDCAGSGSSTWHSCTVNATPLVQFSGDQTHYIRNSHMGVLSLLETVTVETKASKDEGVLAPNAAAVLDRDVTRGTADLVAAVSVLVTFDIPLPSNDYSVYVECPSRPVNDETPWITGKLATGFTINFNTAQTMTVQWVVTRR